MKMLPKNKKGFTVLEMIIVVVVLGILMAAGIYRL
jgi:prepilin-type cleavage/methylation N-terminal domain protein